MAATFKLPIDLAIDADGAVYVSDYFANTVRRIGPDGIISTIAGGTGSSALGDCASAAAAVVSGPTGLAVRDGLLYIVERGGNRIRRVALSR
jgi:serine/threonine-protein kinase